MSLSPCDTNGILFPHHPWVPAGKNRAVPLEAYPRYHLARSRPFSDHAEESMREHSKQKTHIWFLIEGLLQNLTDSPGSFTCSFCGLALHELVPTGRCLAARGLKSGMQTQEQLLRVSFPHGRKPLIFFRQNTEGSQTNNSRKTGPGPIYW